MSALPVVLIVDDDRNTRDGLRRALEGRYAVKLAESGERALAILDEGPVDLLLSDVRMPGMDGLTLLQRAVARSPAPVCLMLTAYGNVEIAVEAMKRGAYDFLMKPLNLDQLDILLARALRSRDLEAENVQLRAELDSRYGLESIIGDAPPLREVFDIVRQTAPTAVTVLLQGESGTGKEVIARAIHRLSPRAKGPFIAVHCAALAPTLLESELFGHEKGAFTGAAERRRGRFELADGGTLFLDEISEIAPAVQAKLLRVLEERRFERVGGAQTLDVDIRLIAATNRDLRAMVQAGTFREDLFFRLDVVSITMPPLRDRTEDIPLLCRHFLDELGRRNGKPNLELDPEALAVLTAYRWPGNVRELRNAIERMVVLTRGTRLTVRDIPAAIRAAVGASAEPGHAPSEAAVPPPRVVDPAEPEAGAVPALATVGAGSMADTERRLIEAALTQHHGNRSRAAQQLGISRRTLQRKLKAYAVTSSSSSST